MEVLDPVVPKIDHAEAGVAVGGAVVGEVAAAGDACICKSGPPS